MPEIPWSSKLDAVNTMLEAIGEAPINDLTSSGRLEVATASRTIDRVSQDVQSKGWWFNIEEHTISPDPTTGELILPNNTLRVDRTERNPADDDGDLVQRGSKLYSLKRRSSVDFQNDVEVSIVRLLSFDELPHSARNYITLRAAKKFQAHFIGDPGLDDNLEEEEAEALVVLQDEELENGDYNLIRGNPDLSWGFIR